MPLAEEGKRCNQQNTYPKKAASKPGGFFCARLMKVQGQSIMHKAMLSA